MADETATKPNVIDVAESATISTGATQDIAKRVEAALFPSSEPDVTGDEEVLEDADKLPKDDDSDSDGEEGSEGLDDIANPEDMTLAGYLGLDDDRIVVDEDGSVHFNAIIDGETKKVPLKDLAANYQLQGHVNNKSMALETQRKEFEEVKGRVVQELQQRVQGVSQLAEFAETELLREYQSIDWNRLRQEDPANWTALRQEFAERAQRVKQIKELSGEETTRLQTEQAEEFQRKAGEYFASQLKAMIADNPTWADESVRKVKVGEMRKFLVDNYGFTEQDALGINDHRLVRLIKDAQAFRQGTKKAEEKRVVAKPLPKFQKPGASKVQTQHLAKARQQKALKAQARKTGSTKDIAAAIESRM